MNLKIAIGCHFDPAAREPRCPPKGRLGLREEGESERRIRRQGSALVIGRDVVQRRGYLAVVRVAFGVHVSECIAAGSVSEVAVGSLLEEAA